ncbi:MAG: molybdenum cofactor guanylyltransferase MobA [Azospirillaceae bacterium]
MSAGLAAVVLAGGQGLRLGGGDKALRPLAGRPLLDHVLDRLSGQVGAVAINANGDPDRFAGYGLPVVADSVAGFPGPLAGVLAGLDHAAEAWPDCPRVLSAPCDTPFLPRDLVARLAEARLAEGATLARAGSAGRAHPVVALWPVALRHALREALVVEAVRKVDRFAGRHRVATVDFPPVEAPGGPIDPFFNVNAPADLRAAEAALADGPS